MLLESGEDVPEGMSNHIGAQSFPQRCERPENATDHEDQHHVLPSLICVRQTEDDGLREHADTDVPGPTGELLLQVTAENGFLADTSAKRHDNPESDFQAVAGAHSLQRWPSSLPQDSDYDRRNQKGDCTEKERNRNIPQQGTRILRGPKDATRERSIGVPESKGKQRPLKRDNDGK